MWLFTHPFIHPSTPFNHPSIHSMSYFFSMPSKVCHEYTTTILYDYSPTSIHPPTFASTIPLPTQPSQPLRPTNQHTRHHMKPTNSDTPLPSANASVRLTLLHTNSQSPHVPPLAFPQANTNPASVALFLFHSGLSKKSINLPREYQDVRMNNRRQGETSRLAIYSLWARTPDRSRQVMGQLRWKRSLSMATTLPSLSLIIRASNIWQIIAPRLIASRWTSGSAM